jgi:hypothetical protein
MKDPTHISGIHFVRKENMQVHPCYNIIIINLFLKQRRKIIYLKQYAIELILIYDRLIRRLFYDTVSTLNVIFH